jgi:hypothetical protein
MFNDLKIKTALLLFTAFVFRLLFVNMSAFAALPVSSNLVNHALTIQKRKKNVEASLAATPPLQSVFEVSQEGTESENDSVKLKVPFLFITIFAFLKGLIECSKSDFHFDLSAVNLHPKKYLDYSVLRI